MSGEWALERALWTAMGFAVIAACTCLPSRPSTLLHAPAVRWSSLPRSRRQRWRPVLGICRVAALMALAVAVGEPVRREVVTEEPVAARDLVICLDSSSSMARDEAGFEGTRFDACRAVIRQFVTARPEDRIGVASFARSPAWSCPGTFDHGLLDAVLDELQPVEVGDREDRTAIGAAVALAVRSLESSEAETRVVILLTDGENNVDEVSPAAAIGWCREAGVVLYAVAVGESQSLPALATAAGATGGQAFAAAELDGLHRALSDIDRRERSRLSVEPEVRRRSFAAWFGALALLWWALGFALDRGPLARWS